MEQNLNEFTDEQYKKFNGQCVMSVLNSMGDVASADQICDRISCLMHQPKELIKTEVKSVLRRGVTNGFLVRFGKNYLLSGQDDVDEIDNDRKSGKNTRSGVSRQSGIRHKRKTSRGRGGCIDVPKNITLNCEHTDSNKKTNQLVVINPQLAVRAILEELNEEISVSPRDDNSSIDLGAIITKHLNTLSEPFVPSTNE